MKSKPIAIISYCHEDVDTESVRFLRDAIVDAVDHAIELRIDSDIPYGGDIRQFMSAIRTEADAALILLTPAYAAKVGQHHGSAADEFGLILERRAAAEKEQRESPDARLFSMIPILFSQDKERSIPPGLEELLYADLSTRPFVRNPKSGKIEIARSKAVEFQRIVRRLGGEIYAPTTLNSQAYRDAYQDLFARLFVDLKDCGEIDPDLFVKTRPFEEVRAQQVFLLIGRKGSGKSTVTSFLAHDRAHHYKGSFEINVDHINLEQLFSLLELEQVSSDTTHVVSIRATFELAWELFLNCAAMAILSSPTTRVSLSDDQRHFLGDIDAFVNSILASTEPIKSEQHTAVLLEYCLNNTIAFLRDCILNSRDDPRHFLSDITARFTFDNLADFAAGEGVMRALGEILTRCQRHVLFTLDGFDTAYSEYRSRTVTQFADPAVIERRTRLEIDFLRGLLSLSLRIKHETNRRPLYGLADFCFTVPKDRFVEVMRLERDTYRYRARFSELNWSGIELAILLRKRLEKLAGRKFPGSSPEDRLEHALEEACPGFPEHLEIRVRGSVTRVPTFLYILRHTFFRPRDVLYYYARVIALVRQTRRRNMQVAGDAVRRAIKTGAFEVIKSEFLNEFKSSVLNLEDILTAFRGETLHLSAQKIEDVLGPVAFRLAQQRTQPVVNLQDKIRILYEIGFLGVSLSKDRQESFGFMNQDVFSFTELRNSDEADRIIDGIGSSTFGDSQFLIHPIFIQYLALERGDALSSFQLSWEYLHHVDVMAVG